jgi:hypothetical protein
MVEPPVVIKSTTFYQIVIFLILQTWALMTFEVSQYQMVTLYETPLEWIGWASILFLTLIPMLSITTWKMKDCIQFRKADWNYRLREVNFDEFSQMVKAYNHHYRQIISILDTRILPLAVACYLGSLFLPFALMRSTILLISLTPIIIAVFLVIFGLLFFYLVFKFIPNSATPEFPTYKPLAFRESVRFLAHIPGIYWSGVRLMIGEAGGFYTLRDPHPVARIEGIEGAVRVDCNVLETGSILSMATLFDSENPQESTQIGRIKAPITMLDAAYLIRNTLDTYIKLRGSGDLLEDVLEEVNEYLDKHSDSKGQKKSSDGLISSSDKGPTEEARM